MPKNEVIGVGVDSIKNTDPNRFKERYNLDKFILCAGRKDPGKNTTLLVQYFCKFLEENNTDLKLVLTGKGQVDIPEKFSKNILDLYLPKDELFDAYSAATVFCLPSVNESFSIVLMESWLNNTPALVHENCSVTKEHCIQSKGGLYFQNYEEFKECLDLLLEDENLNKKLGENGDDYVQKNYVWEVITQKFIEFFVEFSTQK